MLRITHTIKGEEKDIGLKVDGDFIDVSALFSLTAVRKRVKDFMYVNAMRKNYTDMVEAEIKESPIRIGDSHKCYHKLIVKTLLYAIDLLDFEKAIASAWGLETLPMLPGHEFESVTLTLSMCDTYGERTNVPVQIMRRAKDGYYNLTLMLRNVREGPKKTTTSLIKNRTMLYRRMYATSHTSDEIKSMNAGLATKTAYKELSANRRALIAEYAETGNASETWVDANTFYSSMLDCSIDAHELMSMMMSSFIFDSKMPERKERIVASKCVSYEYMDNDRKEQVLEELAQQLQSAKLLQAEQMRDVRKIQKMARVLGMSKVEEPVEQEV